VVVRLCTDDDDTVDFYNRVDEEVELQLEIIDDIYGEAKETWNAGNRFFTYSPLIHRLREGGTFLRIFDLLDERRLEPMEVMLLCQILCRRTADDGPLPASIEEFVQEVRQRLPELPKVYSPISQRMAPAVLIDEVEWAMKPKSEIKRQCGDVFACFFR